MMLLIDADSIVYIIAYNNRENSSAEIVRESCDNFLRDLLTFSQTDDYVGVFGSGKCFRNEVYKFASYKGNRGDKPDFIIQYEKVIKDHYVEKYGFYTVTDFEADDMVVSLALAYPDVIIASPDKDLRQIPGTFLDYGKPEFQMVPVSAEQANYNFWIQMLTGDSTDNVAGIPGTGDVKAKKLLAECLDPMQYESAVKNAYNKYFGNHYGPIIYRDTYDTIKMVQPGHTMFPMLQEQMSNVQPRKPLKSESIFDVS